MVDHGIDTKEVGTITNAAFNLIKIKDTNKLGVGDNRYLIRQLPKWIKTQKSDLLKIGNLEDVDSKITDPDEREKYGIKKRGKVINIVQKIINLSTRAKDQEDPINRLNDALQKLRHEDLEQNQLEQMKIPKIAKAFEICREIENENNELKSFFYELKKGTKNYKAKLKNKFEKK